jgi:hypothetical protein
MAQHGDPQESLAEFIGYGVTALARVDALIEALVAKGVLAEKDAEHVRSRGQELDRQYTSEAESGG